MYSVGLEKLILAIFLQDSVDWLAKRNGDFCLIL